MNLDGLKSISICIIVVAIGAAVCVGWNHYNKRDRSEFAQLRQAGWHEQVNPNIATNGELETLPAIGPGRAANIIGYRKEHLFASKDDLSKVKYVGKNVAKLIEPYVTFERSQ